MPHTPRIVSKKLNAEFVRTTDGTWVRRPLSETQMSEARSKSSKSSAPAYEVDLDSVMQEVESRLVRLEQGLAVHRQVTTMGKGVL